MSEIVNAVNAVSSENFESPIEKLDGIEILVDWAKAGKIDPWNIDIVQVTDMFLQKLMEIKENNLRLTGRTLFFAAVLLKLKSNYLEGLDILKPEEQLEEPVEEILLDDYDSDSIDDDIRKTNIISLEKAITRRMSVRQNRNRAVTLEELIKQLRSLEEIEAKKSLKAKEERIRSRRSYTHFTPDDILEMAHEEYIEDEITKLQNFLSKIFETEEKVELDDLKSCGLDKITAYIALLFLAARSNINLMQDEFYSDLYIIKEVS